MNTLAIAGNAIETRYNVPEGMERWSFNEWSAIHDRNLGAVFQMHPPDVYQDPDNPKNGAVGINHWDWLRQEHEFPIYMLNVDPLVPASVRYPIEEVRQFLSGLKFEGNSVDLFLSSFDYAMGLAILRGYKDIRVYGVEMRGPYEDQRLGCGLWTGIALAHGATIDWHCGRSMIVRKLYGYEEFIRTRHIDWMPLEMKRENSIHRELPRI